MVLAALRTRIGFQIAALCGIALGCPRPPSPPEAPRLDAIEPARAPGGVPFVLNLRGARLSTVRGVRVGGHRLEARVEPEGHLRVEVPALARGPYEVALEPAGPGGPRTLQIDNSPPRIRPPLVQRLRPGQALQVHLQAEDFDGDPLHLRVSAPGHVTPTQSELRFVAEPSDVGRRLTLTASASDGAATTSTPVLIDVVDTPAPLVLDLADPPHVPGGAVSHVELYGYGFDPGVVAELDGAPLPTEVRGATSLVTEIPALPRGSRQLIVRRGAQRSAPVPIEVGNAPPKVKGPLHFTVEERSTVRIPLSATDLDEDPVRMFVLELPPGARFDPAREIVEFTPDFIQGGRRYALRVLATDGRDDTQAALFVDALDTVQPPWPEIVTTEDRADHTRYLLSQVTDDFLDSPRHAGRSFEARVSAPTAATEGRRFPVRVFLHGLGGRPFAGGKGDAFRIYPHDPETTYWWGYSSRAPARVASPVMPYTARRVLHLVEWVLQQFPGADPEQVYLHGTSMGGAGAAQIGLLFPRHFAFAEAMIGQTIARNHRPSRIEQLSEHWGRPQDNLLDELGLPIWDRLDLVRALAETPGARDQFVFSRHAKDDPIIHFGAAVQDSPRVGISWLEGLEAFRAGHLAVWDEGGHGPPDPRLGKPWWNEGWDRARDPHTRLLRNRAFIAFSGSSANRDPGDGQGNGKRDWHDERGFAGDHEVPGDTGWRGHVAGALNRYLRWDTDALEDTVHRFSVPLRARLGPGRAPPEPGYPPRGDRYEGPRPIRASVTPRRVQAFHLRPGEEVAWTYGALEGTVTADRDGAVTVEDLPIEEGWTVLTLERARTER